ncbi:MAG: hypothetical protein PHP70_00130 [Gallionella sp.]|nr:hypothetical protein [Gallionella sp.]
MDLIGSIKYIESRFGGRNRNHGKGKSAQKHPHRDAAGEKTAQSATYFSSTEYDTRLGRQVDITV